MLHIDFALVTIIMHKIRGLFTGLFVLARQVLCRLYAAQCTFNLIFNFIFNFNFTCLSESLTFVLTVNNCKSLL